MFGVQFKMYRIISVLAILFAAHVASVKLPDLERMVTDLTSKLDKMNSTILELSNTVRNQDTVIRVLNRTAVNLSDADKGNSTFIRWGRSDCPSTTSKLVYTGFAGGSYFGDNGGATNHLCMPKVPQYNSHRSFPGIGGLLYGVQYEQHPDTSLFQFKAPCAVCLAEAYSTMIMIPGRSRCYPDWQEAYDGELASGWSNDGGATEYICLDKQPTKLGINTSSPSALLYPVRSHCGSLPCPPYEDNALLTCVVCLK